MRPNNSLHLTRGADAPLAVELGRSAQASKFMIGETMDTDLQEMSREQLVLEIIKLRNGIRAHRDSTGHELCWHHPGLWSLLPERSDPLPTVPEWPQFIRGCIMYRQSLDQQAPQAPRTDEPFRT
jgi:hypothetical protein